MFDLIKPTVPLQYLEDADGNIIEAHFKVEIETTAGKYSELYVTCDEIPYAVATMPLENDRYYISLLKLIDEAVLRGILALIEGANLKWYRKSLV